MLKEPVDILLIEDNPGYVELVRRCLARSGLNHSFTCTARLDAALALLAEKQFGVVLSDLSLPDSSGLATVHRHLRAGAHGAGARAHLVGRRGHSRGCP